MHGRQALRKGTEVRIWHREGGAAIQGRLKRPRTEGLGSATSGRFQRAEEVQNDEEPAAGFRRGQGAGSFSRAGAGVVLTKKHPNLHTRSLWETQAHFLLGGGQGPKGG